MFKRNRKTKRAKLEENWGNLKDDYFNFEKIEYYFQNKSHTNFLQIISDKVIKDIDFHKLFEFADRTSSKIGQQYLYDKLLSIPKTSDFAIQEKIIAFFQQNKEKKIDAQMILGSLNKDEAFLIANLVFDDYISPPKWFYILKIMSAISVLALVTTFFISKLLLFTVLLFGINLFFHYWNKANISAYIESIKQLTRVCAASKELLKLKIPHNHDSEVKTALYSMNKLNKLMLVFSMDSGIKSEIASILLIIWEYIKIFFLIEPLVLFRLLRKLKEFTSQINTLFCYIGSIDSAISVASLRKGLPYFCNTVFTEKESILDFSKLYHPLIEDCVSNSLQNNGNSVLLTGSNMAGKTTFIRALSISVLFGQTINTSFAESFTSSYFKLFSAIRIADDLFNDKSYFLSEVLTIKDFITESELSGNNIFLLDELFKGTNTIERIATGKSVLSFLDKGSNLVFVSTHDIELTDLLKNTYDLYHFNESVENGKLFFDYKLKEGSLKTRNAIKILEISGFPEEILLEARALTNEI